MPAIKLGIFHWQAWDQWKRGNRGGAVAIFLIACALFDAGIIYALVLVAQGKLDWW